MSDTPKDGNGSNLTIIRECIRKIEERLAGNPSDPARYRAILARLRRFEAMPPDQLQRQGDALRRLLLLTSSLDKGQGFNN